MTMATDATILGEIHQRRSLAIKLRSFFIMCKPRVNTLIVFTAMIGMVLAADGLPSLTLFAAASCGIALVAGAAAAVNCVIEQALDARMQRTRYRPLPRGDVGTIETLVAAAVVGGCGLVLLHFAVNNLTMWLTLATFLGYAIIYTVFLKPATPMNIVIGGAAGAMPPVLGWAAVSNTIDAGALTLFLIIFLWTPPHFWALACYRRDEYAKAGLPMLPVTHGIKFTCLHIFLYTLLLAGASLIPVSQGMSGHFYLFSACLLNLAFMTYAARLLSNYSDALARKTFTCSLYYLSLLFAALLLDRLLVR